MKPRSNLDDNFLTQPRAIPGQISNAEDGLSLELTEHMKKYDFLSREKAQQLWYAIPELQQRARMLANGPITGCRCQLVDSTEDMVRRVLIQIEHSDGHPRSSAMYVVCSNTLSVKAIWKSTIANCQSTSAIFVCLAVKQTTTLSRCCKYLLCNEGLWICCFPKKPKMQQSLGRSSVNT